MKENRNHNALVFLTTLSVCLGLVLVGSATPASAQSIPGNGNIRAMVRQSLYGSALEELVRELERLREAGDEIDLENELSLIDKGALLTFATLQDLVSELGSDGSAPIELAGFGTVSVFRTRPSKAGVPDRLSDEPATRDCTIPVSALPRASLEEPLFKTA